MLFYRPPIYAAIHVISGMVGYYYPIVLWGAIAYHIGQYVLNVRVFAFDMTTRPGNSLEHTALKLLEVTLGYLIAKKTAPKHNGTGYGS
jgi:hypothetical protein